MKSWQNTCEVCKDAYKDDIDKLIISLDNNLTHKERMQKLLAEYLKTSGIAEKIEIEFLYTPDHSPDFNLSDYKIHLQTTFFFGSHVYFLIGKGVRQQAAHALAYCKQLKMRYLLHFDL